jgi:hypothetical protein
MARPTHGNRSHPRRLPIRRNLVPITAIRRSRRDRDRQRHSVPRRTWLARATLRHSTHQDLCLQLFEQTASSRGSTRHTTPTVVPETLAPLTLEQQHNMMTVSGTRSTQYVIWHARTRSGHASNFHASLHVPFPLRAVLGCDMSSRTWHPPSAC